ncbi:MAG: DNRLRE domain-containing protein [Anaerolineae bacterium]|nr:DNRLRE domain-containing protein [Anaerolineae bacterium]
MSTWKVTICCVLVLLLAVSVGGTAAQQGEPVQIMFLHHSCGANLIEQGGLRQQLSQMGYQFFDHGYNEDGLRLADGSYAGWNFDIPGDNTDPDGFAALFAQPVHDPPDNAFSYLLQYDVLAFKSCFPVSGIYSDDQLHEYMGYYLGIRDVMDQHPDKLFIVVTQPPLHPEETDATTAARARQFTDWLASSEFLGGHPNVVTFNFFDYLADGSNMLRAEYREEWVDSHPNAYANQTIAPLFAQFIDQAIRSYSPAASPPPQPDVSQETAPDAQEAAAEGPVMAEGAPTLSAEPLPEQEVAPSAGIVIEPGQTGVVLQRGVSPDAGFMGVSDTFITELWQENTQVGASERLDTFDDDQEKHRILIQFDLTTLPPGLAVTQARLELYRYGYEGEQTPQDISVYLVTTAWVEGTGDNEYPDAAYQPDGATWASPAAGAAWTTPGGDFDAATDYGYGQNGIISIATVQAADPPGWVVWDVTAAVHTWQTGVPNYGLILRSSGAEWTGHQFYSSDYAADPTLRPRLVLTIGEGDTSAEPPAVTPEPLVQEEPAPAQEQPPAEAPAVPAEQTGAVLARFPDTTEGIHVFNDQIDVHNLTDAQVAFAATHYAGSQKLTVSGVRRLRAVNPDFLMLHYRLGVGLGYRQPVGDCQPEGEYLAIINGDDWVQEWPGDDVVQPDWFYWYNGERVYWCAWGWYLMDPDSPAWRAWWGDRILQELALNEADGLFADSVTVPNFLGATDWRPVLPDYDEAFEADWTRRLNDWMTWANGALGDQYALIVNAGMLVTSREVTDYSRADGVMVEGFAGWGEYDRFEMGDWLLQMDRLLALINQGRVVILQSYVYDAPERLWTLANYLLVKGNYTYINLDVTQGAEWFPEYDLPIGYPLANPPASIQGALNSAGLYARAYSNGLVLVNPDPAGVPLSMTLDGPMHLVTGVIGGGELPDNADISGWSVQTTEVTDVTVQPGQAAILLGAPPSAAAAPVSEPVQETQGEAEAAASPATSAPVVAAPSTGDLAVFHRSGQTFLTWPEVPGDQSMTYRVYRSSAPIDAVALEQATLLAELPQGSGIYWTERVRAMEPPYEDASYESLRNYVITDLGEQLPDGTGLFVWTAHENGDGYYAVASADGSLFAAAGPVSETVAEPQPVLVWQSAGGYSRVYTQFMDYATYNPTFDAPRPGNYWMGLPNWEELQFVRSQQYAYNYWVGLPTPEMCGGTVPDLLPLILHIEGWGSRYTVPDSALYWCAVMLWGDDPNQSWYFGFSATHDYQSEAPVTTGPIVNYTEARLLDALYYTIRTQQQPAIDLDRIYAYGHSMGGTGAVMFAERYPHLFAAVSASEPMMNFGAAEMWIDEMESKWGARSLNLPVEIRGPDADRLAAYQGTGVWDWQNLGAQLVARRGDEMAFFSLAHGTQDDAIDWATVAQPSYAYFYEGRRAFISEIIEMDHTWLGFREHPNWMFDYMTFRRNESFPALSYASGSLPVPPGGVGSYNLTLEWSASWNNFAGPPTDTPDEWAVVLRSLAGDQTVDVTPRRLQVFAITPGAAYTWQNISQNDNSVVQEGVVVADADGLVTVEGMIVTGSGNRLVIRPQ